MIANRETMQIQQELRTTRRSPKAKPTSSAGAETKITIITPDFGTRIRAYRRTNFPSEVAILSSKKRVRSNSHSTMAKASRGNFSTSSLERFESGVKPSIEEARVLERLFDGLVLVEEVSKTQSTLTELEKILELHGIDTAETDSFGTEYFAFLEPLYSTSKKILQNANTNSKEIESDKTWNGIRKWDASVQCRVADCDGYVPLTPASNTRDFYLDTLTMIENWIKTKISLIPENEFPLEYVAENESVSEAKVRILDLWLDETDGYLQNDKTGILSMKNQSVNTYNIRGTFRTLIWNNAEHTTFGDFELDLYDFATPISVDDGDYSYPSRGAFTDIELRAIHASGDKIAAKIAHRLNICDNRVRIPTCSHCGATRWGLSKTTFIQEEGNFNQLSEIATKTIIEALVGSPARLNSDSFIARDASGKKHTISASGEIMTVHRKEVKQQIADAVGVCLDLFGRFDLNSPHGQLTIHAADNLFSKIYSCPNTDVVGELAKNLKHLKPVLEFLDEENPYLAQDEWAGKNAVQILHAFGAKAHLFNTRRSKNMVYSNGTNPVHELNMLTLTPALSKAVGEIFSVENEDGLVENTLEQHLRRDTNLPMMCPPREHTSFGDGGYLSKPMRLRYPMISNDVKETKLGHRRLTLSDRAIQTLNFLQETEWSANAKVMNIALELLKSTVKKNILGNLEAYEREDKDKDEEKYLAFKFSAQPKVTQNQIHAWMKTGFFVNQHFGDPSNEMSFYHPWTFEWRGRMMTASTILSPQNDDLARGVLRFAKSEPLNEQGWVWLQRHVAALMRGQNIHGTPALQHLGEEWKDVQAILKDKTWESYDDAVKHPVFKKVVDMIANAPMETFPAWGEGDIFSAKCEGFQRLSACITLSEAHAAGGVGAMVSLPISHDASSSIYQHTSALVLDQEMAESVNVLPQENGKPADVYEKIIQDVKQRWDEEGGNPLTSLGMSKEASETLKETLLTRKFAKKPVMTRGYGASEFGIIGSFLTHNGKKKGMFGIMVFADKRTNKEIPYPEDGTKIYKNKTWWRPTAHPASILGEALIGVKEALHFPIAQTIVKEISISMSKVLPGMNALDEFFKGELVDHYKEYLDTFEGEEEDIELPPLDIAWELADGCKVQNLKLVGNDIESISSWQSNISNSEEREKARLAIVEILQQINSATLLDDDGKPNQSELRKFFEIPSKRENGKALRGRIGALIEHYGKEHPSKVALVEAMKEEYKLTKRPTFSRRTLGTSRDAAGESSGLSPNFIHSHDACHMRLVLEKLNSIGVKNVWSVHDAFGAHPNHMEDLRKFAVSSFVETHQDNTLAQINATRFWDQIQGKMNIEDVGRIDAKGPISQYLIA